MRQFEEGTHIENGVLSYQRDDFNELFQLLPDAYTVKPEVNRSEAVELFSRAIISCRHSGPLTADAISERAAKLLSKRNDVPVVPFTLWTKFRADGMFHAAGFSLKWQGIRLRSAAQLPAWLQLDEYFISGIGRIQPHKPDGYGHLILSCSARNEERAVDTMLDALQLILGLLNLYDTWGRFSWIGGRNWTEGSLWEGPNHFVYRKREFRGKDRIWYNPDYDLETWRRLPPRMSRVLKIVPIARKALAALENHPVRDVIVRTIQLLQEGFATRDSSYRLLRYWSALEQLYVETDSRGRSNEKIFERANFAERDPVLSRWKLEHIARLRNDYVHAGSSGDDFHDMGQFLRRMLARHINYWIFNGSNLLDHGELLSFAKLSGDRATLVQMRNLIDRRIDFIDGAPSPKSDSKP